MKYKYNEELFHMSEKDILRVLNGHISSCSKMLFIENEQGQKIAFAASGTFLYTVSGSNNASWFLPLLGDVTPIDAALTTIRIFTGEPATLSVAVVNNVVVQKIYSQAHPSMLRMSGIFPEVSTLQQLAKVIHLCVQASVEQKGGEVFKMGKYKIRNR